MSKIVTWQMVKPRLDKELEGIVSDLTTAPLDKIVALQARHAALSQVKRWFERAATDETIFDNAAY